MSAGNATPSWARLAYLYELEHRYGLTFGFRPSEEEAMWAKILQLLCEPDLKAQWQAKRQRMLADKIDVTQFMVDFVERYPDSYREYQEHTAKK